MSGGRPNFLVIMTDQQRGDALGCEGHPVLLTPNMDAIAAGGIRFRRCYSTCPVCIPARRSLLSGQFPATHGLVGYEEHVPWEPAATLPGCLSAAGYQTELVGRSMHQHPLRRRFGFDHMVIQSGIEGADYETWLEQHAPPGAGGPRGAGITHNDWTARPWHLPEWLHYTNWTAGQAEAFLRQRDPSCPFFLVVSFLAPHPPFVPPPFYFDRYLRQPAVEPVIGNWAVPPEGRPTDVATDRVRLSGEMLRAAQAGYFGLINHIDDQVRRLLNPVEALIDSNTVVLFTSDHGEMLGDHDCWRKSLPYEGSARIPLLVRGPRHLGFEPGVTSDLPVALEDVMPTLLELAGVPIPASVEGRSLVPCLRGAPPAWREYVHGECAGSAHYLTDGIEKYIWFPDVGREQFFNLAGDPQERHDLARVTASAGRVAEWRRRLVNQLRGRPEGFTDGNRLIAGRPYQAVLRR
ncbi:MAG: arylsulfatase [Lentisphaerae bacterium]|nr:arylsulfatase [Lentisphaerota bacterium]